MTRRLSVSVSPPSYLDTKENTNTWSEKEAKRRKGKEAGASLDGVCDHSGKMSSVTECRKECSSVCKVTDQPSQFPAVFVGTEIDTCMQTDRHAGM